MICVFDNALSRGLFGDDRISACWDAPAQLHHLLAFEGALARALEAAGRVEPGKGARAAAVIEAFTPDLEGLAAGMARDGVPVPALVTQLRAACGDDAAAVHSGATSQDVMDTALSLTLREVNRVLEERLRTAIDGLVRLAERFGENDMMGRTRMQAALPIPVCHRVAAWHAPLAELAVDLGRLRPRVERLQLGGAVGTRSGFDADGDAVASHIAGALGLSLPERVWHTDRGALAEYAGWLSRVSGQLGKLGQDVVLMAQQGIDDITLTGGGGSSAMPHKNNPVRAELLITLARYNAVQVSAMHGALVHEQERSGAAWMLEWMVLPGMTVATARACSAAVEMCEQITRLGSKGDA